MVQKGATGKTAAEIQNVLGSNVKSLSNLFSAPPKDCIIANAMVAQNKFVIKQEFSNILEKEFKAEAIIADFQNEPEAAVSKINSWAEEKTNGAVSELINSLDPLTVLVLLNAVYFKGSWLKKFDKEKTVKEEFYCMGSENNKHIVDMMHIKDKFFYAETENFQALNLLYDESEIAMLVLLPVEKDGLKALESQLKSSFIQDLKAIWHKCEVEISLPKFRLEFSEDFIAPLQNLGIKQLFQEGAELSGINDSTELKVSEVRQKAVFVLDEEGCEAAAATAMVIKSRKLPIIRNFTADHPFLFVIYDTKIDLILFMGHVEEL